MNIKVLRVSVVDQDGNPVRGALISLQDVPKASTQRTRIIRRGPKEAPVQVAQAVWKDLDTDVKELKIHCEPPEGYVVVDSDPRDLFDEDLNISPKGDGDYDELAVAFIVEAPRAAESIDKSTVYKEDETSKIRSYEWDPRLYLGEFIEILETDIENIRQCNLCETFSKLSTNVEAYPIGDWCDSETEEFLERLKGQFDGFFDECSKVEDEFSEIVDLINSVPVDRMRKDTNRDWLYQLAPETLQERTRDWAGRMASLMTAYKGVYDLIHLEVSSQQLPGNFLDSVSLEVPFERYQYLQKQVSSLSHNLAIGPVGTCLEDLANECAATVDTVEDLYESLERYDRGAPAPAREITARLGTLLGELKSNCREIDGFSSQYEADQNAAGLVVAEEQLRQLQEGLLGLIGELREAVRLHKLLPSWDDRAEWLAMAKQGMTEAWGGLTQLVQRAHECIEMIESGIGEIWLQYSTGTSQASRTYVTALRGGTNAQAQLFGQIYTALNQAIAEFRQQTRDFSAAVRDIATFIPLKGDNGGGGGASGGVDGSVAARKVANAIAAVVGRPIGGDSKAFQAVLTGTFPEDEQTGKIVREPVRTVVSLAVEQGQLAAGQGSLSHEVQLVANDALKILKGLKSIGPDTDTERAEALTRMVEVELMALKEEAGRVDRPRHSRVDEIFQQLADPGGHLEQLRGELELNNHGDVLGNPDLVTRQEAQIIASMDLLDGYAGSLRNAYNRFFATPAGQDPRDGSFSGRLSFISLLFSVVANSVREVESAMDAVDFHQPERRTTFITDPVTGSLISVDGILSWIYNVAVQEGPDLISRSGLIGLNRVLVLVNNRLRPLVVAVLAISQGAQPAPHPSLQHSRVRNALQQLDGQLGQF